jgi:hypothetical protein
LVSAWEVVKEGKLRTNNPWQVYGQLVKLSPVLNTALLSLPGAN